MIKVFAPLKKSNSLLIKISSNGVGSLDMKIKTLIVIFIIMLIFVGFCGCFGFTDEEEGPEVKEYFDFDYEVDNETVLRVVNVNGEINIVSWSDDNIFINATKRSKYGYDDLDKAEIRIEENNNIFTIAIIHTEPIRSRAVDLEIKIPYNVTFEYASSTNGAIYISDVKGNPTLSTTNGQISTESINGYVKATSTNGRIDIKNTTGIGDISTVNGRISVEIYDFIDDIKIETTNGKITVYINQTLNANIMISTVNGEITVDDIIDISESTSKTLEGTIGNGGDTINIKTTNGGIMVFKITE